MCNACMLKRVGTINLRRLWQKCPRGPACKRAQFSIGHASMHLSGHLHESPNAVHSAPRCTRTRDSNKTIRDNAFVAWKGNGPVIQQRTRAAGFIEWKTSHKIHGIAGAPLRQLREGALHTSRRSRSDEREPQASQSNPPASAASPTIRAETPSKQGPPTQSEDPVSGFT